MPPVDDGELVGIITLGDVRGASPSEVSSLNRSELDYLTHQIKVQRIMSRHVVTVTPDTPLADAAQLMIERKISGLPVMSDDGRIIGMITESDIFRTVIEVLQTANAPTPAL
ncbi:MAG: CBS domain-containing protein [Anaerolineae bacterium]|nr:CBS domain-containing protein [Anaerolineae bacterium]